MAYPMKEHDRSNSYSFLSSILSLFEDEVASPIILALENEFGNSVNIMQFLALPVEDFPNLIYDKEKGRKLNRSTVRMMITIQDWIKWEMNKRPGIDFEWLSLDDYDDFLTKKARRSASSFVQPTSQLSVQLTTPISMGMSATHFMSPASFMPNVKLDVKQYPIFNGDMAAWSKFKRGVLSIASTHGLDEIFEDGTIVPAQGDSNFQFYTEKNKFVYSMWISRVTSGLALSILRDFEATKGGRGVYLKYLDIYEGKHNMKQVACMAMTKLNSLDLAYNSPGGMPVYVTKFREALQDLRDAGEPISDVLAKSFFLSKIQDNDYRAFVDNLISSKETFEECVQRFLDKYNMMNQNNGTDGNRQANAANNSQNGQKGSSRKQNNNTQEDHNNQGQVNKNWIDPEVWKDMTWEQKTACWNKKNAEQRNQTSFKQNTKHQDSQEVKFGPGTTRIIKNTETWDVEDVEDNDNGQPNNNNNNQSGAIRQESALLWPKQGK